MLYQITALPASAHSHTIWQAHKLQPHRRDVFKLSRDPRFLEKLTDVVGLDLDPPEQAIVLCVDEKSQIQARAAGFFRNRLLRFAERERNGPTGGAYTMTEFLVRVHSVVVACAVGLALGAPLSSSAHHSFAVYDFETAIPFEGVVSTLTFRNPHISMTLTHEGENGETETINFIEGAPANMLVRQGLDPEMIKPGTRITAIGSPRRDDPDALFLRRIILEDGREFQ